MRAVVLALVRGGEHGCKEGSVEGNKVCSKAITRPRKRLRAIASLAKTRSKRCCFLVPAPKEGKGWPRDPLHRKRRCAATTEAANPPCTAAQEARAGRPAAATPGSAGGGTGHTWACSRGRLVAACAAAGSLALALLLLLLALLLNLLCRGRRGGVGGRHRFSEPAPAKRAARLSALRLTAPRW